MLPVVVIACSLFGSFLGTAAALIIYGRRAKFCHFAGWMVQNRKQLIKP